MQTRDIIVIGASMGGIEALSALVRQLPEDLPAAVFVVQHTSVESPALLAAILSRAGPLPAVTAEDRMPLRRGRIYVAPPDRHLLLTADGIRVGFGPRENRSRPGIRVELMEPIPDVAVDAARVRLVLVNLMGNAIKYADAAKPVRWVRIAFGTEGDDGAWWVCVSDNGMGIPLELQPRVFQRFFRAHPGHADGSGLGLAIVQEAVQQLRAEIHFDSEPGVGTTFRFSLPPARGG